MQIYVLETMSCQLCYNAIQIGSTLCLQRDSTGKCVPKHSFCRSLQAGMDWQELKSAKLLEKFGTVGESSEQLQQRAQSKLEGSRGFVIRVVQDDITLRLRFRSESCPCQRGSTALAPSLARQRRAVF